MSDKIHRAQDLGDILAQLQATTEHVKQEPESVSKQALLNAAKTLTRLASEILDVVEKAEK